MKCNYSDILDNVKTSAGVNVQPKWWDEFGVPRFCEFHPDLVANIYAREVLLGEIACQSCNAKFIVAFSCGAYDEVQLSDSIKIWLETNDEFAIMYGDPPNINCCDAGPTMNSCFVKHIEFWKNTKDTNYKWEKVEL
jgi:hypothetical protein